MNLLWLFFNNTSSSGFFELVWCDRPCRQNHPDTKNPPHKDCGEDLVQLNLSIERMKNRLFYSSAAAGISCGKMAEVGHLLTQVMQPVHFVMSITAWLSTISIAFCGQLRTQAPQAIHAVLQAFLAVGPLSWLLQYTVAFFSSRGNILMIFCGQTETHFLQPLHMSERITAKLSITRIASNGQAAAQSHNPRQPKSQAPGPWLTKDIAAHVCMPA